MGRFLMKLLALFFPWIVMLLYDNPGGAIVALIMQATVIGWPFATLWAWKTLSAPEPEAEKPSEKSKK